MGIRYVCAGLGETGEVFVYLLTQICCRVNFPEQQGAQFRYTVPGKNQSTWRQFAHCPWIWGGWIQWVKEPKWRTVWQHFVTHFEPLLVPKDVEIGAVGTLTPHASMPTDLISYVTRFFRSSFAESDAIYPGKLVGQVFLYMHLAKFHIGSNSSDFNFKLSHVSCEEFSLTSAHFRSVRGSLMRKSSKLLKGTKIRQCVPR